MSDYYLLLRLPVGSSFLQGQLFLQSYREGGKRSQRIQERTGTSVDCREPVRESVYRSKPPELCESNPESSCIERPSVARAR